MNGKIGRQVFFDQVKGGKATGKPHKRLKVMVDVLLETKFLMGAAFELSACIKRTEKIYLGHFVRNSNMYTGRF